MPFAPASVDWCLQKGITRCQRLTSQPSCNAWGHPSLVGLTSSYNQVHLFQLSCLVLIYT